MVGQDIVYANQTGDDIDLQAKNIVQAMTAAGVQRLIFVASLGIYDEVPGQFGAWNRREIGAYLPRFSQGRRPIEVSGRDYTMRPAWLTDHDEIDYETTEKDEPFKGTEVSPKKCRRPDREIIESPTPAFEGKYRCRQAEHGWQQTGVLLSPDARDFAAMSPEIFYRRMVSGT